MIIKRKATNARMYFKKSIQNIRVFVADEYITFYEILYTETPNGGSVNSAE